MAFDILIIDDENDIRDLIAGILEDEGYETRQAHDADSGLEQLNIRRPNLVFLDIWMQGSRLDGLELLDEFQSQHPSMPVVMISGHGNLETAVSAIKRGAYDYIEKPFKIDRLLLITQRAMEASRLKDENIELKKRNPSIGNDLVGNSPAILQVKSLIEKAAPTNSRIFIAGPSGVGKGHCARLIHQNSERNKSSFVEFNSSLYDPNEVGVALFGKQETDKNGQIKTQVGALESAHGGTLYLSEVSTLPMAVQTMLLRTLVQNKFHRVGGETLVPIDVRIISSSSQNIIKLCDLEEFRADLFHRLSVVPINLTPIKDRREDLPELVESFIAQACKMHNISPLSVGGDALAVLQGQDWPRNALQLRNSIERLVIMLKDQMPKDGIITASMLPPDIGEVLPTISDTDPDNSTHLMSLPLREAREVFESKYLLAQIDRFGGNISKTAEFVGMERSALHRKIKSLGL